MSSGFLDANNIDIYNNFVVTTNTNTTKFLNPSNDDIGTLFKPNPITTGNTFVSTGFKYLNGTTPTDISRLFMPNCNNYFTVTGTTSPVFGNNYNIQMVDANPITNGIFICLTILKTSDITNGITVTFKQSIQDVYCLCVGGGGSGGHIVIISQNGGGGGGGGGSIVGRFNATKDMVSTCSINTTTSSSITINSYTITANNGSNALNNSIAGGYGGTSSSSTNANSVFTYISNTTGGAGGNYNSSGNNGPSYDINGKRFYFGGGGSGNGNTTAGAGGGGGYADNANSYSNANNVPNYNKLTGFTDTYTAKNQSYGTSYTGGGSGSSTNTYPTGGSGLIAFWFYVPAAVVV